MYINKMSMMYINEMSMIMSVMYTDCIHKCMIHCIYLSTLCTKTKTKRKTLITV